MASTSRDWPKTARTLVAGGLAYNAIEAVVAIGSGIMAGSIALIGFGLDSVIECAASAALLWRLSVELRGGDRERVERAERRVGRFVGATFVALAAYVVIVAGLGLWRHDEPAESVVGIVLASVSLVLMPLLSLAKVRAAREIGSAALRAEAKETIACAYLSFTLLLGLVANAAAGLWWADPVAALLMVPWLVKEGIEGLRGEEDEDEPADRDRDNDHS